MSRSKVMITCDGCGNDLSDTSNMKDYRLVLANDGIASSSAVVTCMGAYPAIKETVHFCGVDCLRIWLDKEYPADKGPYHGGKCWAGYQRKCRAEGTERQWK